MGLTRTKITGIFCGITAAALISGIVPYAMPAAALNVCARETALYGSEEQTGKVPLENILFQSGVSFPEGRDPYWQWYSLDGLPITDDTVITITSPDLSFITTEFLTEWEHDPAAVHNIEFDESGTAVLKGSELIAAWAEEHPNEKFDPEAIPILILHNYEEWGHITKVSVTNLYDENSVPRLPELTENDQLLFRKYMGENSGAGCTLSTNVVAEIWNPQMRINPFKDVVVYAEGDPDEICITVYNGNYHADIPWDEHEGNIYRFSGVSILNGWHNSRMAQGKHSELMLVSLNVKCGETGKCYQISLNRNEDRDVAEGRECETVYRSSKGITLTANEKGEAHTEFAENFKITEDTVIAVDVYNAERVNIMEVYEDKIWLWSPNCHTDGTTWYFSGQDLLLRRRDSDDVKDLGLDFDEMKPSKIQIAINGEPNSEVIVNNVYVYSDNGILSDSSSDLIISGDTTPPQPVTVSQIGTGRDIVVTCSGSAPAELVFTVNYKEPRQIAVSPYKISNGKQYFSYEGIRAAIGRPSMALDMAVRRTKKSTKIYRIQSAVSAATSAELTADRKNNLPIEYINSLTAGKENESVILSDFDLAAIKRIIASDKSDSQIPAE